MNEKLKRIVTASLFAALVCVATLVIQIPSPLGGYINLGDALIILASVFSSPIYAFFAAAIGSALADVFLGYMIYAPATFIIKGAMALIVSLIVRAGFKNKYLATLFSASVGECVMILGYYVFEGFLYGFAASLVNIVPNGVQAAAGVVLGTLIATIFEKNKTLSKFFKI